MNDGHPDLDTEAPGPYTAELIATLHAEQHVLPRWADDTAHPRLAACYRSLAARLAPRAEHLMARTEQDHPALRDQVLQQAAHAHETARTITFELSRLKWLLANRRARSAHHALPVDGTVRQDEADEAAELEALIAGLARGLC